MVVIILCEVCFALPASASPKAIEPIRRQRRVSRRVLDIAVPQVGLQRPRVDPVTPPVRP
jgi:hypothetical protein